MMFSVPVFDLTTYLDDITSYGFGLLLIKEFDTPAFTSNIFNETCDNYVALHTPIWTPIILLNADNYTWTSPTVNVSNLRNSEQIVVDESDYSNPNNPSFIATFD